MATAVPPLTLARHPTTPAEQIAVSLYLMRHRTQMRLHPRISVLARVEVAGQSAPLENVDPAWWRDIVKTIGRGADQLNAGRGFLLPGSVKEKVGKKKATLFKTWSDVESMVESLALGRSIPKLVIDRPLQSTNVQGMTLAQAITASIDFIKAKQQGGFALVFNNADVTRRTARTVENDDGTVDTFILPAQGVIQSLVPDLPDDAPPGEAITAFRALVVAAYELQRASDADLPPLGMNQGLGQRATVVAYKLPPPAVVTTPEEPSPDAVGDSVVNVRTAALLTEEQWLGAVKLGSYLAEHEALPASPPDELRNAGIATLTSVVEAYRDHRIRFPEAPPMHYLLCPWLRDAVAPDIAMIEATESLGRPLMLSDLTEENGLLPWMELKELAAGEDERVRFQDYAADMFDAANESRRARGVDPIGASSLAH